MQSQDAEVLYIPETSDQLVFDHVLLSQVSLNNESGFCPNGTSYTRGYKGILTGVTPSFWAGFKATLTQGLADV
jgi:hypothetical protein